MVGDEDDDGQTLIQHQAPHHQHQQPKIQPQTQQQLQPYHQQQLQKHTTTPKHQKQHKLSKKYLRDFLFRVCDTFVIGVGAVPSVYVSVGDMSILAELDSRPLQHHREALQLQFPRRRRAWMRSLKSVEEEEGGVQMDDLRRV